MLDAVREMAHQFDVLHFHVDVLHYPLIRDFVDRTVTTLHGRLDLPEVRRLYSVFSGAPLVSISFDQRKPMPPVNWAGMVYHGLPRDLLPFNPAPKEGYLAFIGRISPEKRPDRAIEIATRVGAALKIAAKIDRVDQDYWEQRIRPMIDQNPRIEFIGEINEKQKAQFLGEAKALLFPIDWPEPFGMVMIEAMACGTPVIAFRAGSSPEIIDDGVSGFLVDSVDEAVMAVRRLGRLDRRGARAAFESPFHSRAHGARLPVDLSVSSGRPGAVAPHVAASSGSAPTAPPPGAPDRDQDFLPWGGAETRPLSGLRSGEVR